MGERVRGMVDGEEEALPDFEEVEVGKGAGGGEVGGQGLEGFFAGGAICWMEGEVC